MPFNFFFSLFFFFFFFGSWTKISVQSMMHVSTAPIFFFRKTCNSAISCSYTIQIFDCCGVTYEIGFYWYFRAFTRYLTMIGNIETNCMNTFEFGFNWYFRVLTRYRTLIGDISTDCVYYARDRVLLVFSCYYRIS